jgi:hypothetical protein
MSVSLKASDGRWVSSFIIPLLLSSNSLLARILERDKAETFVSVGLEIEDCIIVDAGSSVFIEVATVISTFGSSTEISIIGVFSAACLTTSTIE